MPPPDPQPVRAIKVASTGPKAERFAKLPIATTQGRVKKVAMWLGSDAGEPPLPELRQGDQLFVSAEFQLTTDCEAQQSDCVQQPYTYEPIVTSQLLLTSDPALTAPTTGRALALTKPRTEQISHARHHHVVVYDNLPYSIPAIPWAGPSFVSLVLSAHNPVARTGQILIVGQQEPGGQMLADMATLNVVRLRGATTADGTTLELSRAAVSSIPVVKGEKRVVYSQELKGLRKGEQLTVRVRLDTGGQNLRGPARASVRVYLADSPTDTGPGAQAKLVTASRGDISRKNGTNRLPKEVRGSSIKSGVLRVTKNVAPALYVNTVLETGDPKKLARPGDVLRILTGGTQRVIRFGAELDG